jgi:hypothetical protein
MKATAGAGQVMKNLIIVFFMLLAAGGILRADAVTFEASVNSPRISLDEVLRLTLTVTGVNDNLSPMNLPVLDGFSAKYLGPSTSVSIVNGDYHSERSFIYDLFPNKTGHFQIPPISANISGQTYTTKPIDVDVIENSAGAQASKQQADQAFSAESLKDKIQVQVQVGSSDVYLNQRVPLTVKLLVSELPIRDIQYPQFEKTGILVDDFEKPEQGSEVIRGIRYDTVVFKTNIYPGRLGDLTLGPVQIQGNILYKTGQENPFNQDNDFFGANVFNNFFDSYATRPVSKSSEPVVLHVSALPENNRPDDFSGAIGQFDFRVGVSPLEVRTGDPLTVKMDVQGNGNFKNIQMPVFRSPGFKAYPPQIRDTGNEKKAEEVVIPTSPDIKEVPALRFSYFDTSVKDYKTITQGPFSISVAAPGPDQEFKAIGFADISRANPMLAANQSFWGGMINKVIGILKKLKTSVWFWLSSGFVLATAVLYWLWRRFQHRLVHDRAFARRLKALREARQSLNQAEKYVSSGNTKDFYALLSKILRDYLADKWNQPAAALNSEEILNRLKTAQFDEVNRERVKTVLDHSDMVCFAGAPSDAGQIRIDLSEARDLIARFEKFLK